MSTKLAQEALLEACRPNQTNILSDSNEHDEAERCVVAINVYLPLLRAVFRHNSSDPASLLQEALDKLNKIDQSLYTEDPLHTPVKRKALLEAVVLALESNREEVLTPDTLASLFAALPQNIDTVQESYPSSKVSSILKLCLLHTTLTPNSNEHGGIFIAADKALTELQEVICNSPLSNEVEKSCLEVLYSNFADAVINTLHNNLNSSVNEAIDHVKYDFRNVIRAILLESQI
ncbi:MAG: hypothetical protein CL578_05530 [Alteromonadaceae bacterium]|uniref:Uncharacterized protein n=1 Tax=Paraglaciecola agarilytica NO2 TaxID=1125747 RepID=A0ABQ0I1V3_9ALTE|nr:hypothetical protein [Paraglaciecola agarilytica]MBN24493.1 hypothetical protein [Alteromonadaceae bacterium]GAC03295.1 hypothetical protein GAGA_0430 [Paraglaciecola agarilytica NO2]|tara:strand:- start:5205 stop:5903 length:699 start_codon:yes stop_codon:yes gene_type:complete